MSNSTDDFTTTSSDENSIEMPDLAGNEVAWDLYQCLVRDTSPLLFNSKSFDSVKVNDFIVTHYPQLKF